EEYVTTDSNTGNKIYIGTKEQFIDAYMIYMETMLKKEAEEAYADLEIISEDEQKEKLQEYYDTIYSAAPSSKIAYLTVTDSLEGASIGITAENAKIKRLVAEGGVYKGFLEQEPTDTEPYILTDQDL